MSFLLDSAPLRLGDTLRDMLAEPGAHAVPGAHNGIAALLAKKAGFRALYLSGAALSASQGLPDLGLISLDDVTYAARWIVRAAGLPLIVDGDTGFGTALNTMRAMQDLEAAGVAGIQIEDQVMLKRCGHLAGKEVVAADEMAERIRAARKARSHMLIIARTDSKATHDYDEAVRRARLYRGAGADIIFPEALETEDEFKAFAKDVKAPLLANMTEFGKTPYFPLEQFADWGYKLVIYPVTELRIAAGAIRDCLNELAAKGSQADFVERMLTRADLYELIRYKDYEALGQGLADNQHK